MEPVVLWRDHRARGVLYTTVYGGKVLAKGKRENDTFFTLCAMNHARGGHHGDAATGRRPRAARGRPGCPTRTKTRKVEDEDVLIANVLRRDN